MSEICVPLKTHEDNPHLVIIAKLTDASRKTVDGDSVLLFEDASGATGSVTITRNLEWGLTFPEDPTVPLPPTQV